MAKPRMIQGQFGSINYDSSQIEPPGVGPGVGSALATFNTGDGLLGVDRHNDQFYVDSGGSNLRDEIHFMTFDYIDLRDLMRDHECMDDVTINVQRLREVPLITSGYNLPMGNGIEETLLFVLGDLSLDSLRDDIAFEEFVKAGFAPINIPGSTNRDFEGSSLPFQVLYREIRRYMPDLSQTYSSPNASGTFAGPAGDSSLATTTFCGRLQMTSRTIGGYPDLLVGPGITVVRVVSNYLANRSVQGITGGGPTDVQANQLQHLAMKLSYVMPALQFNVIGTQRKMTDTEIATYYSNILVNTNDVA